MTKRWNYSGDVNLQQGGFFWKEDCATDYVLAVRVTPCSDAGGPYNMFWIETGSIFLSDDAKRHQDALTCCGWTKDDSTLTKSQQRWQLVDAMLYYAGIEPDCYNGAHVTLRIGKPEDGRHEWNPETRADVVLRANASLENYVRKNYLR